MNILLLAIADNGGGTYFLSRAINEHTEHHARAVRWTQNYLNYPYDLLHPAPDTLRELWAWADVIHIRDAATYLPPGLPRKPTVITYTGNFYRKNHTEYHRRARQAGAVVTVSTPDLLTYDKDRPAWLPNPRDDKAHLRKRGNGDDCLVIHAPTVRGDKGTATVIDALDDMPGVTLQLIEGMPYDECLRLKATGHILIDQFKYGYGNNAIEAWAIGMPVISGALPQFMGEHTALGPLPFVAVRENVESIREAVEHLRTDRRFYRDMAQRGRDHFFRYHHSPVVAARAIEFYREAMTRGPVLELPPPPKPRKGQKKAAPPTPGAAGFVSLEYRGDNWGTEPWTGAVTGAIYKFGKARPVQWVDKQDAVHLLRQAGRDGKPLFREAQP